MTELGEALVPIRATLDKLDGDLAQARGRFGRAVDQISQSTRRLGGFAFAGITAGITAAAGAVVGLGAGMVALASSAEPLIGLQAGFATVTARIGTSAEETLSALQEASGGLITNRQLMESFNKAASLVSDDFASTLPEAMSLVQRAANSTGQDMGFLFDSLVTGIGRVSPMILDNLGIQVSLAEVTETAAEMFGKSAEELSKQEQQAALTEVVMGKLNETYGDVPAAEQPLAKIRTAMANLKDEIGLKLLPVLAPLAARFLELAQGALPLLMGVLDNHLIPAVETVAQAISNFTSMIQNGIDPITALTTMLAQLVFGFGGTSEQVQLVNNTIWNLIGTAQQLWDQITTLMAPIVEAIAGFVSWKDVLIALAIAIGTFILPIIGSLIGFVLSLALPLVAIIAVVALLRNAWENNWGGIQEKTAAVLAFIRNLITNAVNFVTAFWAANGDAILASARQVWMAIQSAIQTAITIVRNVVETTVTAVLAFWEANGAQILASARQVWMAIQSAIETATIVIKAIVAAFTAALRGDWREFGRKLREAWQALWDKQQEILTNAKEAILRIVSNLILDIIAFFQDQDWGKLGSDLIDGLVAGLNSGVSKIADKLREIADAAMDAWDGFWGNSSPSKLMFQSAGDIIASAVKRFNMDRDITIAATNLAEAAFAPVAARPALAFAPSPAAAGTTINLYGGQTFNDTKDREDLLDQIEHIRRRG